MTIKQLIFFGYRNRVVPHAHTRPEGSAPFPRMGGGG